MPIPMHPVESSNISYIGYDYDTQELYITFSKGDTYKYNNVPEQVFKEFLEASSVGKYYINNIRGQYTSNKI